MTAPLPGSSEDTQLQHIFERLGVYDFETRGEVREFLSLEPSLQLVYLYLQMKSGHVPKTNEFKVNFSLVYTTLVALATGVLTWMNGGLPPTTGDK